jgi:hypothetical protein
MNGYAVFDQIDDFHNFTHLTIIIPPEELFVCGTLSTPLQSKQSHNRKFYVVDHCYNSSKICLSITLIIDSPLLS